MSTNHYTWLFENDNNHYQTFDDSKEKRSSLISKLQGDVWDVAGALVTSNSQGAGIFFAVNEFNGRRKIENVKRIRAVFLDLDTVDFNRKFDYPIAPSQVIESSPGKHHVYWLVDDMPAADFTPFQKALCKKYGGDPKVTDVTRVMRVPGFNHMKDPKRPFMVKVISGNSRTYSSDVIQALVPDLATETDNDISDLIGDDAPSTDDLIDFSDIIGDEPAQDQYGARAYAKQLLNELRDAPEGERNNTLNRVAFLLFGLVKGGQVDYGPVYRGLHSVAGEIGLPPGETETTINSAYRGAEPDNEDYSAPDISALPDLPQEPIAEDFSDLIGDEKPDTPGPFDHLVITPAKVMDMKKRIKDDTFILPNIAVQGHITVLYAQPNTGKTLTTMWMIKEGIKQNKDIDASKIIYVNADDTFKGLTEKAELANEAGFKMVEPSQFGSKNSEILDLMKELSASGQAHGWVVVLDTLKKFTSTMDKTRASIFGNICRDFAKGGGTVIMLAHVNKKRDKDGELVHGGTSDIVDDCDCSYIIDVEREDATHKDIVFTLKKSRGISKDKVRMRFSKRIRRSYFMLFNSVEIISTGAEEMESLQQVHADYKSHVEALIEIIETYGEDGTKTDLVDEAVKNNIPLHRARMLLDKYDGVVWGSHPGKHNRTTYYIK